MELIPGLLKSLEMPSLAGQYDNQEVGIDADKSVECPTFDQKE